MILLDTNIISELMKSAPDARLITWIDAREPWQLYTSATTVAEITYGISVLPEGKRRKQIEESWAECLRQGFSGMVLPFTKEAAEIYGVLMADRKRLGRPVSMADGQIAAIAKLNNATLATRNTKDFSDFDIRLVNPLI
ncbi:MAG: type II toxin-antitoxin system VapC family toxin [Myxococcaceae bacterium]